MRRAHTDNDNVYTIPYVCVCFTVHSSIDLDVIRLENYFEPFSQYITVQS